MTNHRKFKDVIRQRAAKTGESFTTAKMHLEAQRPRSAEEARPEDQAPLAVPDLPPADEVGVPPTLCPGCRKNTANPSDPYLYCDRCSFERAGIDHSPDYWD